MAIQIGRREAAVSKGPCLLHCMSPILLRFSDAGQPHAGSRPQAQRAGVRKPAENETAGDDARSSSNGHPWRSRAGWSEPSTASIAVVAHYCLRLCGAQFARRKRDYLRSASACCSSLFGTNDCAHARGEVRNGPHGDDAGWIDCAWLW